MVKISIIIPIYNVEAYIGRCLDSILSQTFTDFEVICIDDGSTDSSGEICEKYADNDTRIQVFHIDNQGVSNARNYGLSKSSGEWFSFVDADDWVETNFLEILYNNAIESDCSVSACNFQRNTEYSLGSNKDDIKPIVFNSPEECIHNYICAKDSMQGMIWNKLYRADEYKHIKFDVNIKVNEDCLYTYEVLKNCRKACYCRVQLYHWFFREESACHSRIVKKDFSPAEVFLDLYNRTMALKDENIALSLKRNYIRSAMKVLLFAKYDASDDDVKYVKRQCKEWKKDVWRSFNKKEKVKYVMAIYAPWFSRLVS